MLTIDFEHPWSHTEGATCPVRYGYDTAGRRTSLATTRDGGAAWDVTRRDCGTAYVPFYDSNGNVTRYLDANGGIAAMYAYDAFGKAIAQSGPLADHFRHRFSTKCLDSETGLYYYGYRFYAPSLMRWLNRDPIGERGGVNLYVVCGNNVICNFDS